MTEALPQWGTDFAPSCTGGRTLNEQKGEPIWLTGSAEVRLAGTSTDQGLAGFCERAHHPGARLIRGAAPPIVVGRESPGGDANGYADDEVAID